MTHMTIIICFFWKPEQKAKAQGRPFKTIIGRLKKTLDGSDNLRHVGQEQMERIYHVTPPSGQIK